MTAPDRPADKERREEWPGHEPRRPPAAARTDAAHERTLTRFVDPYDMRAEPQPEEPGYGHGV